MRDAKSYCVILLDDNNRKTLVRMHFNHHTNKWLGTFVGKDETKNPIEGVLGIYDFADKIAERLGELDPSL